MQILTHNPSLPSVSRYPVALESTHVPSSPSSTELDKCTYFESFRGHQQLASPPPSGRYGTVRIQVYYSTPQVRVSPVFFVQTIKCYVISPPHHFLFSGLYFDLRTSSIQPNARITCSSLLRHILSTSHEGGR